MKILVHLHLYYQYMLAQMLAYIKNLEGYDYDLYVTMVDDDFEVKNKIIEFNRNAKIIMVENRGFDVAPFLTVLSEVDLDKYDYVIKLHTKRDMDRIVILCGKRLLWGKNCWREKLLDFIATKENLKRTLSLFENPQVGMISHYMLIINQKKDINKERALLLLDKVNLKLAEDYFVAGTMFICRADLLKVIKSLKHNCSDFESYGSVSRLDGTLAHVYERLFGFIVWSQNKKIVPLYQEGLIEKVCNFFKLNFCKVAIILLKRLVFGVIKAIKILIG